MKLRQMLMFKHLVRGGLFWGLGFCITFHVLVQRDVEFGCV